jgi:hypothetical protein
MPGGAHAQEAPSVTVTPDSGLVDGQTVLVEASGFTGTPTAPWAVLQCDASVVGATDATTVNERCIGANGVLIQPGPSSFSTPLTVVVSGTSFQGGTTITCGHAPADCVILVGQLLITGGAQVATTPITFGPPTPQSKGACKNGGWSNLANDQGQPFRNQGSCVSYVVARRR